MGTNPEIRARDTRAEDAIGAATSRLEKRAARAGAIEKAIKESQTVLITLLSCRFMSDISDSACHPRFVTGAWQGGTFNPRRDHRQQVSTHKRARPSISRQKSGEIRTLTGTCSIVYTLR